MVLQATPIEWKRVHLFGGVNFRKQASVSKLLMGLTFAVGVGPSGWFFSF